MGDLFRDTKVRYLGYANEVGEAFRPLIPRKLVHYSYGIAFGYILADTTDKGLRKLWDDGRPTEVLCATGDAFMWQFFASLAMPGIVINRIVHYSNKGIAKYVPKIPPQNRAWMTVGIGLACIPVIITPIDKFVDLMMNMTYRQIFK